MKIALVLCAVSLTFCGCQTTNTHEMQRALATSIAKGKIAQKEQWAYDGDYSVSDYIVDGKKTGTIVQVRRISDPKAAPGTKARYDAAGPVIIIIDENGKVISYKSPYHKQQ